MKTEPSKAILRIRKRKDLWQTIWAISTLVFITCVVAFVMSAKMGIKNATFLVTLLATMLFAIPFILISTLFIHIYQTKLQNLEFRQSHPSFAFHDWFMENKDDLVKKGIVVPLDEAIRQSKEKD